MQNATQLLVTLSVSRTGPCTYARWVWRTGASTSARYQIYLHSIYTVSSQYLHNIYSISTQYLLNIYTASLSDCPAPAPECHRQPRRHRGLGRHRGQQGEGGPGHNSPPCVTISPPAQVFRAGTSVQLVCLIRDVTQPPAFIFWSVQYSAVKYSTLQYSIVPSSSLHLLVSTYSTVQCSTVQYSNQPPAFIFQSVQYSSVQCSTQLTHLLVSDLTTTHYL